jgi:ABC-type glycerol-3-phosphate transport system permease component
MLRDFRRSFEYYFQSPHELPVQMAAWWGRQPPDTRIGIAVLLGICALYALVYVRPIVGSFLAVFFPYTWLNTDRMRAIFFRGTSSEFEQSWKARGQPTNARWRYLFDVFYYFGPLLVVAIALAICFMVLVGYPNPLGEN